MITAFHSTGTHCDERQDPLLEVLAPPTNESVTWVAVGGVHKMESLESFGKRFPLHSLRLEDIANTDQWPKLDEYETSLFLVREMLSVRDRQDILVEQVSRVRGRSVVRSFQENGTDVFNPVRDHLRGGEGTPAAFRGRVPCSRHWSTRLWITTSMWWRYEERRSKRCTIWWSAILTRRRCARFMRSNGRCCFCGGRCGHAVKRRTLAPDRNAPSYRNQRR
jgi:hypothetical protein